MHRIDGTGATAENKFTEGNPSTGLIATQVTADILNAFQEEIAGVIEASGAVLDKADNTQLLEALRGARLHATNGYQKLPSGLIVQWGTILAAAVSGGAATVTLPIAFPTTFFWAGISDNAGAIAAVEKWGATIGASLSVFSAYCTDSAGAASSSGNARYLAIGN